MTSVEEQFCVPMNVKPVQLAFTIAGSFVSECCPNKNGPHFIPPIFVAGVEELDGLADSPECVKSPPQLLAYLSHDRLFWRLILFNFAARKPVPTSSILQGSTDGGYRTSRVRNDRVRGATRVTNNTCWGCAKYRAFDRLSRYWINHVENRSHASVSRVVRLLRRQ